MIDRVGLALDDVTTGQDAGDLIIREIFSPELWAMMRPRLARAAILAMREPSEAMLDAADGYEGSAAWQPMIDQALKET